MIPYLIMILLYIVLALLIAFDAAFSSWQILAGVSGLVWLRIHFITLGILAQLFFGALPLIGAMRHNLPRPKMRWDIWLLLNAGVATLLVGIPVVSATAIISGGTLIFVATILLISQLLSLQGSPTDKDSPPVGTLGRKFYIAGLSYFLLGILVGTGLWTGWSGTLGIVGNAKEVHIHANSWGLMSLLFAGLLIDYLPIWTKRPLATPQAITTIFWLMTLGAFGLVFGPWFSNRVLLVAGLLLHLTATLWLLRNLVIALGRDRSSWTAGMWHLAISYFWILAPILMAPFVLFEIPGLPGARVEANAPQALIYGWALQFGFAIVPYFFMTFLLPDEEATLGGSWFSLLMVNVGSIFLWTSIFVNSGSQLWQGLAYGMWLLAIIPIATRLFQIGRQGLARLETATEMAGA